MDLSPDEPLIDQFLRATLLDCVKNDPAAATEEIIRLARACAEDQAPSAVTIGGQEFFFGPKPKSLG